MYKIIGADGKVYGPVAVEQLRQWITEGRANAQTQVQPEGATGWKSLGTLPELADLFGAAPGAAPPTIAPPPITVNTDALAAEILARGYDIDIGNCIGRAWELIKGDFWLLVGAAFVGQLIAGSLGIISLIIGGPMLGGLCALYLKKIRGQPAQFGDAFIGFSVAFVPLMLAHIVSRLLTGVGLLLCLIPGIYFGVCWVFTIPLVIDKKLDFWPAMELSRKVVSKHWWMLFGLLIVLFLLTLAGLLACCVGVIVTGAIAAVAEMYAYEDIFGARA